jgi:phosphoribosyl 1,2-cyclic phosphodiesterase
MYTLKLLYSGSDGNAALLCTDTHRILIDAGKNAKTLCKALDEAGVVPDALDAIFLTHEHRDHTAALDVFLKHHPMPVHVAGRSTEKILSRAGDALRSCLVPHPPLYSAQVGPIALTSFPTSHDSVESVGYHITVTDNEGTHSIGYATDLG